MIVQVFSDIHLEHYDNFDFDIFKPKAKILFLVGDIGHIEHDLYKKFIDYVSNNWEYIYIVLGNHEFYSTKYTYEELYDMYDDFFLQYSNVMLVTEGYEYKISDDVYIIGGVGWTTLINNYENADIEYLCKYHGFNNLYKKNFNDFNYIKKDKNNTMDVEYFNNNSKNSKSLLLESINEIKSNNENSKIILLTHFPYGKHSLTSSPKYHKDNFMRKKYFCNGDDDNINMNIINNCDILIAGHTHYSYDFTKDGKRYISNQMGYDLDENGNFDISKVYSLL
jgi:predicted phosphodiesterase